MEKAEKADILTLKDIFLILEVDKSIPEVAAEIPGIGPLDNLYCYVYDCFSYCVLSEDGLTEEYQFYYNQVNIVLKYLIDTGLLTTTKQVATLAASTLQIPSLILEQHIRFTVAELHGHFENHPDREYIRSLWEAVMLNPQSPLVSLYVNSLKKIIINQVVIVGSKFRLLKKYDDRVLKENYKCAQAECQKLRNKGLKLSL